MTHYEYVPLVFALLLGPGAFLPRPEDRRQPPFLDQLYTSNGGCSTSMCHRVGAGSAARRCVGSEAGWPAAPPGRLVALAAAATLLVRHAALRAAAAAAARARRPPARPPHPSQCHTPAQLRDVARLLNATGSSVRYSRSDKYVSRCPYVTCGARAAAPHRARRVIVVCGAACESRGPSERVYRRGAAAADWRCAAARASPPRRAAAPRAAGGPRSPHAYRYRVLTTAPRNEHPRMPHAFAGRTQPLEPRPSKRNIRFPCPSLRLLVQNLFSSIFSYTKRIAALAWARRKSL